MLYALWVRAGRPTGLHLEEEIEVEGPGVHEILPPEPPGRPEALSSPTSDPTGT